MTEARACERCLAGARLARAVARRLLSARARPSPPEIVAALGLDEAHAGAAARRLGVRAPPPGAPGPSLCRHVESFPPGLMSLPGIAPVLHVRAGEPASPDVPWVALTGPRHPSPYAASVAVALGRALGRCGVGVAGVLERGVALEAMLAARDAGGPLLAVDGGRRGDGGQRLVRDLGGWGIIVSEWEERPPAWAAVAAARLVAAAAELTVVIEAAADAPALVLADLAQGAGRDVAAVPGRIDSASAAGSNALLREGAHVITAPGDVLDLLLGAQMRRGGARAGRSPPAALS